MTKQSQNLANVLQSRTGQEINSLMIDLSLIVQESLAKQTQELLTKCESDYTSGKAYVDDLGIELTKDEAMEAIKSRFGRYMKWDFNGIKTFNERLLKDIAYGLNLKYENIKDLAKELKAKDNGILIFKDGKTMDFVEFKEGKVLNPKVLYSAPKMLANGKFHRFAKEVVAIIQ